MVSGRGEEGDVGACRALGEREAKLVGLVGVVDRLRVGWWGERGGEEL